MDFIPVSEPLLTSEDLESVAKAYKDGWISGEGPFVSAFENKMAEYCQREFAVAVSNGTDAIDIIIETLGLKPGDEVILPSFTIISCLSQILRAGATPVFVDCDPDTWNMDVTQVKSLINKNTRAVMAVHIYGLPVDMDPLLELIEGTGILLIEDAAEAHGLTYKNKPCGSFGLASSFSFYANKNVTTGEGGMILTNSSDFAEQVRSLKNLSHIPGLRFHHEKNGWNSRLTGPQCALGTSQLSRISRIISRRKEIANFYIDELATVPGISFQKQSLSYADNTYWVFGILMDPQHYPPAQIVQKRFDKEGIGTRPFFYPLHKQPVLGDFGFGVQPPLPVAELLGEMGFYIPNGLGLSNEQLKKVATVTRDILNDFYKG